MILLPNIAPDRTLFVSVPGLPGTPKAMKPLRSMIIENYKIPEANWVEFQYPVNPIFSNLDCAAIARGLAIFIDQKWGERKDPGLRVVIVAHSMGTVIARRALLDGIRYGDHTAPGYQWPYQVDRMILIAGIGRGLDLARSKYGWRRAYILASGLLQLVGIGATGRQIMSGSAFISQLRIDWIRYNQSERGRPGVVHVLGKEDEISTRDDVIDLDRFDNVCTIDVDSNHDGIVKPSDATSYHLVKAFGPLESLPGKPQHVKDVVIFLLHGIRDSKTCFLEVKQEIERRSGKGNFKIETKAPGYKRFSLIDFLAPWQMRGVKSWFAEEYTQELARNPKAVFHFGGHSNGTRVLGLTLQDLPRMRFDRIYLAASALVPEYPWTDRRRLEQVVHIRADRGSEDWPVGVVARILNRLGYRTIGPAGQDGFHSDAVREYKFQGGHGAMFKRKTSGRSPSFCSMASMLRRRRRPPNRRTSSTSWNCTATGSPSQFSWSSSR